MKIKFLLALLIYSSVGFSQRTFDLATAEPGDKAGSVELSEDRYEAFKTRSIKKVSDLGNYISTLTNKTKPSAQKKAAVNLAVKLFQDETKIVEVSSTKSATRQFKIRDYLNRLRVLKYSKVDIEWYDIQYISNLRLGSDGSYYGTITIFQKFTGYHDDNIAYSDVTQKNIDIKVTQVKTVRGTDWEVLLGNISVVETK